MAADTPETLEEFRASFAYGSRTDLNFKFLKSLSDAEAAEFLRRALELLSDAADVGDVSQLVEHWYRSQVAAYQPAPDAEPRFKYDDAPWATLGKPVAEARIAIVTAGGVYVEGDDPMGADGPTQAEVTTQVGEFLRGEPSLSTIPSDTPRDGLRVRHPGYDVRAARRDYNAVFPIDRLLEVAAEGLIGGVADEHYAFVGATSQLRLRNDAVPTWAARLRAEPIDAVLLVAT